MAEETVIFKAIENIFTNDPTIVTLCPGGIALTISDETSPKQPRVAYEDEGTTGSQRNYGGKRWEQHILFKIYSEDGDVLSQIIDRLDTIFTIPDLHLTAPLVSGGGHIKIDEIRRYKQDRPNRGSDLNYTWIAEVPYVTTVNSL